MSDLISRSALKKEISKWLKPTSRSDETEFVALDDIAISVIDDIDKQTTAYDVSKVVDELEKAKDEIASEDYCRNIHDKEKCDGRNCFKCCAEYLIEIVKQGSVSDDLCEWKLSENKLCTYDSGCGHEMEVSNTHEVIRYFNYCPYCGKKIKVVK